MTEERTMSLKQVQKRMEKLQRLEVNFPSGLTFTIGDGTIRPEWADLRRAFWHLHEMGISDRLVPHSVHADIMVTGNKDQLHWLIPYVVERAYHTYGTGLETLDTANDYWRLSVVLWLMRCYWHYKLGGPKPDFTPTTVFRSHVEKVATTIYTPTYACPECTKRYVVPPRYSKRETISKYFVKWLVKHYNEYHKYSLPEYTW